MIVKHCVENLVKKFVTDRTCHIGLICKSLRGLPLTEFKFNFVFSS